MSTTTSTSLVNSVLSALGSSSSGIDVTSAVSSIISTDEAGMRALQTQQTTLAAQTSAINQLQTEASSLSDALNNLSNLEGPLTSVTATSSNTSVLTATVAPGTASTSYTVVVNSLATTASAYSSSVASSSAQLGTGSFDITVGGNTTTISTGGSSGIDTLDQLVSSINSQGLGVNASVVTDSSGARLSLVASNSGAAANFTVSGSTPDLSFTQPTTGSDASLSINGVPITSASNTVTAGVAGLTLNLQGHSTSPVTVSVAPDSSSISSAINSFVTAYNTLIKDVNSQFAFNVATSTAGTLAGDSTVEGLQSALLGSTNYSYTGGSAFSSLAQLGITTNQDGTLSVNTSTLNTAISNNAPGVTQFFQGTALNGFADSVQNALNTYTDPSQGAFTVELNSISSENLDLTNQIATDTSYYATLTTTLTTQYNNIDIELQQLPGKIQQTDALLGFNTNSNSNG